MSYREQDFDRGRARDWDDQDNGYRGQFGRRGRFGGWNDEGQEYYGDPEFRGQERYGGQFGVSYGQGGYGYRGEGQYGGGHGQGAGYSMWTPGDESYRRGVSERTRGWASNAEQGWGNQGRPRGGSWDQNQDWEMGASGRGHWGQGYGDQRMMNQSQQAQQQFGRSGYGSQRRPGGTSYYEEVWLIPGPHSGRGPRGYQRNDQRIEEDICERLTQHGQIDAEDIQVKVKDGEATLTGTVESRQSKRMAEDALDSIPGIKDVHNQLRVQQGQGREQDRTDQDELVGQTQMRDGQSRSTSSRGESRNQSRRAETAAAGAANS